MPAGWESGRHWTWGSWESSRARGHLIQGLRKARVLTHSLTNCIQPKFDSMQKLFPPLEIIWACPFPLLPRGRKAKNFSLRSKLAGRPPGPRFSAAGEPAAPARC